MGQLGFSGNDDPDRILQRFVEVIGHPETGTTGRSSKRGACLRAGGAKFGYGPSMLGDLDHLTLRHDLSHEGAQFCFGLKDPNPSH